jgi:hypothetical protein
MVFYWNIATIHSHLAAMGFWDDLISPLLLTLPPPSTYSIFTSSSNDTARHSAVLLFALVTLLFIKWGKWWTEPEYFSGGNHKKSRKTRWDGY